MTSFLYEGKNLNFSTFFLNFLIQKDVGNFNGNTKESQELIDTPSRLIYSHSQRLFFAHKLKNNKKKTVKIKKTKINLK